MAPRRTSLAFLALAATLAVSCSHDDGAAKGAAVAGSGPRPTNAAGETVAPDDTQVGGATGNDAPAPTGATTPLLEPGVTSNTVGGPRVACKVDITGDVVATFTTYDDNSAFSSDYYLSAQEIADASKPRGITTLPGQTLPSFTAPPRPEGTAPLSGWFLLNCQGGDITVSIFSNPNSTTDDVPFKSGKYDLSAGGAVDDPTQFLTTASFYADPSMLWQVDPGARIKLNRFDSRGAQGTFVIPMSRVTTDGAAPAQHLVFKGAFDVRCKTGANCDYRS
jgi:hypothetical protein